MLGISVYLSEQSADEQEQIIIKMSAAGFKSIFTSLHIPEDDPGLYAGRLKTLGSLARMHGMELFADISPGSLGHLGFTWDTASGLLEWGVSGLRLDYGISEETIASLSKGMRVALNASTLTQENIDKLRSAGLSFSSAEAWHNFYPRPETGLDREEFNRRNAWLRSEGLQVMAFIPGDGLKRGPLQLGLPTLEDHRGTSPFAAYLDLLGEPAVGKILIGDPSINDETLEQFRIRCGGAIPLRARPATSDARLLEQLESVQTNRPDPARDVIRSAESRLEGLVDLPVEPLSAGPRPAGSITVDNRLYGRYQGEVQITKRDLTADEKVNVLGRVIDEDLPLLRHIGGGQPFRIRWVR
ncbi:DUF871 domain-containing protein [Edaphobacillus lindanitolerans]|uniref:Outer surface protein n=1 Tax=Edaphobacillus lindanitolerans TaxID=550447 RepID=A0A1U7PTJ6_9BACI|nr:MupG family TIM beta-alpha barrel fold protein [Edaphobacillus lindanitolerans]SIT92674.1 hypothetical protein SAMN05428946_2833 [Edaphobacillus lindanitolerans]